MRIDWGHIKDVDHQPQKTYSHMRRPVCCRVSNKNQQTLLLSLCQHSFYNHVMPSVSSRCEFLGYPVVPGSIATLSHQLFKNRGLYLLDGENKHIFRLKLASQENFKLKQN